MTLRVASGRDIDLLHFDTLDVDIDDIANSLAKIPRFGGHTDDFYSVAEHCIIASYAGVSNEANLALLLHDASEAYVGDVTTPLKHLLNGFKDIENNILAKIYRRYNLTWSEWVGVIKEVDYQLYSWESGKFFYNKKYAPFIPGRVKEIEFLKPEVARDLYLERFSELCQKTKTLM